MPSPARISPVRSAAYEVLLRVATHDSYAVELLHSNLLAPLSPSNRGLTTELVMGVLRWQQRLDQLVESATGKSIEKFDIEVKLALRIGAYQLLYLDRIPARAAVHESVELVKLHGKRSAAPLINAVLRKLSRETASASQRFYGDLARTYSHPAWLIERWTNTTAQKPLALSASITSNVLKPRFAQVRPKFWKNSRTKASRSNQHRWLRMPGM